MNKPIKPNITIPENFAQNGVKTDFDDTLLADGFDNLRPDVLAGDNLNKFIDDTYQGLNYGMAAADAINLINEGETLTVVNGELTSGASGGGLEIGDIGPAPLGIDETKGKRRYLNGQVIIQEQYVQFTNKVKSAQALYPNLFVTEEQWQATVIMSAFGACYKFVVDDEAGTIRLPKITGFIQGLTDLSKLGDLVEAGLPNITGTGKGTGVDANYTGAFKYTGGSTGTIGGHNNTNSLNYDFDASLSNPIYDNSPTVQPESGCYPYFIQVATGAETEDNIINEVELNNPYTLFDSKYSPNALYNASWLKSEGQYNSGAVYVTCYEGLLVEYNTDIEVGATTTLPSGTEYTKKGLSVNLSTETFTDYDFVVNTAEETFRLPLLTKDDFVVERSDDGTNWYRVYKNGWVEQGGYINKNAVSSYTTVTFLKPFATQPTRAVYSAAKPDGPYPAYYNLTFVCDSFTATTMSVFTKNDSNQIYSQYGYWYACGQGAENPQTSLYFYVGETVQNANLINAGRIEEKLVDKVDTNASNLTTEGKSLISSYAMPSSRYIDLTLGASGATYTAPANGWFSFKTLSATQNGYISAANPDTLLYVQDVCNFTGAALGISIPCLEGSNIIITYHNAGTLEHFRFIYAEGEVV